MRDARRAAYVADLAIPCPSTACFAEAGQECKGLRTGIVHFARRLKRLLAEKRPDLILPQN